MSLRDRLKGREPETFSLYVAGIRGFNSSMLYLPTKGKIGDSHGGGDFG